MRTQKGFSLIELLTVLLIITAMTKIALETTKDFAFQGRYEVTKDRYEKIKRAIIGRPDVIINGQPDISGFVADMGRLPRNLQELLVQNYCMPDYTISDNRPVSDRPATYSTHKAWCEDMPNKADDWLEQSDENDCSTGNSTDNTQAKCESNGGVWTGWKGPYLISDTFDYKPDALSDGWGNEASSLTDHNYGWKLIYKDQSGYILNFVSTPWDDINSASSLDIYSLGKNQAIGGETNTYDQDYPTVQPVISQSDWKIDISQGVSVSFRKPYTPAFGSCGFLASQATGFTTQIDCENAGGNWDGSNCTTIDASSCKSVGGKWKTCQFNSAQCASFTAGTGTTWQESCEYTENSCTASSGTWDTTNHVCTISGTTCPGASCSHSTPTACTNDKGVWVKRCIFNDSTACETVVGSGGAGATFDSTNKPDSCVFTISQCEAALGKTDGKECSLTHAEGESSAKRFTKYKCQIESKGSWLDDVSINGLSYEESNICLKLFYRKDDSTIGILESSDATVEEDGSFQTLQFTSFSPPATTIPMGINTIGIYKYDGSCTDTVYPSDRAQPIRVQFIPHANLPIINW